MKANFRLYKLLMPCLLLLLGQTASVCAVETLWRAPREVPVPAELPRLTQPIALDGDIKEWGEASGLTLFSRDSIENEKSPHHWRDASDAGMEIFFGWNEQGICIAAKVADDEVINRQATENFYYQDCIQLMVDGRTGGAFMKDSLSGKGAYSLDIRPPTGEMPAAVNIPELSQGLAGLKFVGKKTVSGYNVELIIPWSAFPEISPGPGAEIALQCWLIDYDAYDGDTKYPLTMNYMPSQGLWPGAIWHLMKWRLVDKFSPGKEYPLAPRAVIGGAGTTGIKQDMPITLEFGGSLAEAAKTVTLTVVDPQENIVLTKSLDPQPQAAPWGEIRQASYLYHPPAGSDGYYQIRAELLDAAGRPLGFVTGGRLYLGNVLAESRDRLAKVDLPALSQKEPFKAASWLAAGAALDKLRRGDYAGDAELSISAGRELRARLNVLKQGRVGESDTGIYRYLNLTALSDSQVTAAYAAEDPGINAPEQVWINFSWGAIPLATARATQQASADAARTLFALDHNGLAAEMWQPTTFQCLPARRRHRHFTREAASLDYYLPDKQLLLFGKTLGIVTGEWDEPSVLALDIADLEAARVTAAVVADNCPAPARKCVESWAEKNHIPLVNLAETRQYSSFLYAGEFPRETFEKDYKDWAFSSIRPENFAWELEVLDGDRLLRAMSPSQVGTEQVMKMLLAGEPVKPVQVETLKAELLKTLPAGIMSPTSGSWTALLPYCGDLHAHTFYSDGRLSPAALMLQAMSSYLDFATITDHDTIEGAQVGKKLLAKYGFDFPLIIGEEVTTNQWHCNGYPLQQRVSPQLPLDRAVAAIHQQGGIAQWNHPGFPNPAPDWVLAHLRSGLAGTGLDIWEHVPGRYQAWRQAGTLPIITGTTDTHNGTFSPPERTVIFALELQEKNLMAALRGDRIICLSPEDAEYIYGSKTMLARFRQALARGGDLKQEKARRLQSMLRRADLAGLLEASSPKQVSPQDIAP
jgi:hypothetical protein